MRWGEGRGGGGENWAGLVRRGEGGGMVERTGLGGGVTTGLGEGQNSVGQPACPSIEHHC